MPHRAAAALCFRVVCPCVRAAPGRSACAHACVRRLLACLFKCAVDNDFLTVVIVDLYSDSIGTRLSDTDLTVLCGVDGVLRR